MAILKDDHDERIARLEHMLEELRVQTTEYIRLTKEARAEARETKDKSQRERAARQSDSAKDRLSNSRRKPE
jgi:hypothetical protein